MVKKVLTFLVVLKFSVLENAEKQLTSSPVMLWFAGLIFKLVCGC